MNQGTVQTMALFSTGLDLTTSCMGGTYSEHLELQNFDYSFYSERRKHDIVQCYESQFQFRLIIVTLCIWMKVLVSLTYAQVVRLEPFNQFPWLCNRYDQYLGRYPPPLGGASNVDTEL